MQDEFVKRKGIAFSEDTTFPFWGETWERDYHSAHKETKIKTN